MVELVYAKNVIDRARKIIGAHQDTHGDSLQTHADIAELWSAYLSVCMDEEITILPSDVAKMMVLLKMARSKNGDFNEDDYVDMIGYASLSCEITIHENEIMAGLRENQDGAVS